MAGQQRTSEAKLKSSVVLHFISVSLRYYRQMIIYHRFLTLSVLIFVRGERVSWFVFVLNDSVRYALCDCVAVAVAVQVPLFFSLGAFD